MKKWIIFTILILVGLIAYDLMALKSYGKGLLSIKGAYAVIGLVVGSVLMLVIKWIGKIALYRSPNYYEKKESDLS